MWIVEDFRDAPMRPRAMFEDEGDARDWADRKLGPHQFVHRDDVVRLDLVRDIVNSVTSSHWSEDDGFVRVANVAEAFEVIESKLRGAA